jgi:hypothetical protein
MPRGYRCIIVALVGLTLIGAGEPPKEGSATKQEPTQSELLNAASSISAAISNIQIPVEKDPGCGDRKDRRESDLCAQWKAADAASDAAQYAYWTMLLGFAGTLLLVATFWETRQTSRAELRAYITVDPKVLRLFAKTGEVDAGLAILNTGKTPAFNALWAGNIVVSTDEKLERDLGVTDFRYPQGRSTKSTIHAERHAMAGLKSNPPIKIPDLRAAIQGEEVNLYVFGTVWYDDAFSKRRLTNFCFRADDLPEPGAKPDPMVDDHRWSMTPFHNDST